MAKSCYAEVLRFHTLGIDYGAGFIDIEGTADFSNHVVDFRTPIVSLRIFDDKLDNLANKFEMPHPNHNPLCETLFMFHLLR